MAETANRQFLRKCVAKICQNVGWNFIQATPLELLTDLLQEYITSVAKTAYSYALHCGNTEANISHLALAFKDMGVSVSDLKEYVRYVDSSSICDVPKYPIPKESHLNLLKPGSREVVTRPFHIHEHLPPMHPHLEDQELSLKQSPLSIDHTSETSTPANSPKSKFKRPGDPLSDMPLSKRSRYCEEEDRPLRELCSVMMTTSGFLSPAREGKLPEARTPVIKTELTNVDNSSPSNDAKQERKKKKINPETKKVEKDQKINNEPEGELSKEEDVKSKKILTIKDQVKQKSKKLVASKLSSSGSESISSNTNKSQKHVTKKNQSSVPLPLNSSGSSVIKKPKLEKPNLQLKREDQTPSSSSASENQINPDYKLSCEPDKQKLNIFKRISKVKEDTLEEVIDKGETEVKDFSQIDITIESVIKREMVQAEVEIPTETKDEVIDIETVQSPNPYSSLILNNKINISSVLPTPIMTKSEKKKKKEKNKVKKDLSEKSNNENNGTKSKTFMNRTSDNIEPESVENAEPVIVPVSFIPCPLPTAPGLIPSTTSLVPPILGAISKSDQNQNNTCIEQCKTVADMPHNISLAEPVISTSPTPVLIDGSNKTDVSPLKKKEHKKDKKEKIKKKKKNKLKNKDKSEKKKLKLEKKGKLKDKIKQKKDKKEKKKDKEIEEGTNDSTSGVPKITFKLGPAAPVDSTNENILRKIVIKPVIKKQNDVLKNERAPSPELARFSPLIQLPKHKPKVQSSENTKSIPTPITTSSNINTTITTTTTTTTTTTSMTTATTTNSSEVTNGPIESLSLPPSLRFDSEGNKVWICPGCERQDDGSAMIGCDGCDAWYHWVCVGIQVAPESQLWYCTVCLNKEKIESVDKKKKSKKKNGSKKAKLDTMH